MIYERVSRQRGGWGQRPQDFFVAFRSAKARPFAERKATLVDPNDDGPQS